MKRYLEKEKELLEILDTPQISEADRRSTEVALDDVRESMEESGWNSMQIVYDYMRKHPTGRAWSRSYTASGFTNPQFLVSSIMDSNSPLKSCLLYHGVGVGKTCAAIAASSSYKNPRQILVLTPSQTLVKNWKEEFIGKNHCGRYIWNIPSDTWRSMTTRKKTELLHSHVEIMGYLTFANRVQTLSRSYMQSDDTMTPDYARIRAVRTLCNNRIILMDEIHNTRQQQGSKKEDDVKKIRPVLSAIARYAKQTKLLLLSATPIYNDVDELEWIVNLMRLNQGLSTMSNRKWLHTKTGEWKSPISASKQYLASKIRGFISYIRGENPYTFPRRLDPSSDRFETQREKGIVLTMSDLSVEHKEVLDGIGTDAFGTQMIQNTLSVQSKIRHGSEWSPAVAQTWSPKLWTAWEAAKDSLGPVFMYSQYLAHGINEMASILEEMGWIRVGGKPYTESAGKVDPYCWANKCRRSEISKKEAAKPFVQAKYALVDGTSSNLYEILKIVNEPLNRDGSRCAVLLGSRVIEVGVSLKRFRQVHILEPWFHLNSMEQAIGRAIRNRSHIDLPKEQRNLTVFLHCAKGSKSDMDMYQRSIEKMQMMSQVTKIMAQNAIDCDIQKHMNYIRDSRTEDIEDCFGEPLRAPMGDTDFSARCGYSTCEIECVTESLGSSDTSKLDDLYQSLSSDSVFPTNLQIIIERLPAFMQGVSAVDAKSVANALGVSGSLAEKALHRFAEQNIPFHSTSETKHYIKQIETETGDPIYVVSLYPNTFIPRPYLGIAPTRSGAMDSVRIDRLPEPLPVEEEVTEESGGGVASGTEAGVEPRDEPKRKPKVDIASILQRLDRELRMVEGLTPMRKSIEKKKSLEVAKLDTDAAIRKQAGYQRYIGYAEERKAGQKKITRRELYPSIVITFVEHLRAKQKDALLRYLVETTPDSISRDDDLWYTIMYLRDSLSSDGLGLHIVPFLMKYKEHIQPYIPKDVHDQMKGAIRTDLDINAYAFTEKKTCRICVWNKDGTWTELPNTIVLEWKEALRPSIVRDKRRGKEAKLWIESWNNPSTYEFTMKVPRKDPLGENPKSKKAKVLGGLCGQALFVKHVEELVAVIETLTDIRYKAASKRIQVGDRSLPSGIYWPNATGKELLQSLYLGGVNKRPSKTSTGSSLCEEMEYILRIIAYSGKSHPMSRWITFHSSLEYFIQN